MPKWLRGCGNVNDQTKQRFIAGLDALMKTAGANSFQEALAIVKGMLLSLASKMDSLGDEKAFEDKLSEIELSAEDERMVLAVAENLPGVVNFISAVFYQDISKEFPSQNSGRPKSLPLGQEPEVREFIGRLFLQGTPLSLSKKRAAQKFGISLRTVERVWADRKKKERQPSVAEMVAFLTSE